MAVYMLRIHVYIVITQVLIDPVLPGLFRLVQAGQGGQATRGPARPIFRQVHFLLYESIQNLFKNIALPGLQLVVKLTSLSSQAIKSGKSTMA